MLSPNTFVFLLQKALCKDSNRINFPHNGFIRYSLLQINRTGHGMTMPIQPLYFWCTKTCCLFILCIFLPFKIKASIYFNIKNTLLYLSFFFFYLTNLFRYLSFEQVNAYWQYTLHLVFTSTRCVMLVHVISVCQLLSYNYILLLEQNWM